MFAKFRFVLLALLLVTLVGCSGVAAGVVDQVELINDTEVTRSLQWVDGRAAGPSYTVGFSVPEEWVGNVSTRTRGNTIAFVYTPDGGAQTGLIVEVQALSESQYWQQTGSYPELFVDLVNRFDTIFVYQVPIFVPESGLAGPVFEELVAGVPMIRQSFTAERVQMNAALFRP